MDMDSTHTPHRVVIVGGGFGGLYAARRLRRSGADITLVDRRNFHLFQPLLYQVATGVLSPANIAAPLRALFDRHRRTEVLMTEVERIDLARRCLHVRGTLAPIEFDTLIVATGSEFNYFGHDEWNEVAPGLKSIEDALAIRSRVLSAFEAAEVEEDPTIRAKLLTFVIVGGGPTGIEMAGALAEVARHTLRGEFRRIDPSEAKILLLEASPHVLGMFPAELRDKARQALARMGVEVRTGVVVTDIRPSTVVVKQGDSHQEIHAHTILWTAGVKASPLGAQLAPAAGISLDRTGRVPVESDCSLPNFPNVFVIGDLASLEHDGKPLPALAPVAMQQGRYVADVITRRLAGRTPPRPFHYRDKGMLATIGRNAAVAQLGRFKLDGFIAWITWLLVHILYLAQFQNRILVLVQWFYSYITRGRAARLITGEADPQKFSEELLAAGGRDESPQRVAAQAARH
jgi:NADH dehydrogenase